MPEKQEHPVPTADVLITNDTGDSVLLIQRGFEPFKGHWALPGGFMELGETIEQTAIREVKEEVGLDIELEGLLGVYSDPGRDPRIHTITSVFFAKVKKGKPTADKKEVTAVKWVKLDQLDSIDFAFDHATILEDYKIIMSAAPPA